MTTFLALTHDPPLSSSLHQALQQELDGIQTQLSALYRLSDDLTKNMGTSTIVLLTSRQSALEQRVVALRQLLSQHIGALHEDLSQVNRFREAFAAVKTFLEHAGSVLAAEDPSKTAEQPDLQNRLEQLKELLTQFQVGVCGVGVWKGCGCVGCVFGGCLWGVCLEGVWGVCMWPWRTPARPPSSQTCRTGWSS